MKAELIFRANDTKVGVLVTIDPRISNAEIAMLMEHLEIEKEKLHELYKLRVNKFSK